MHRLKNENKLKGDIMQDCIFCKIINGDIPSSKVYEDEKIFAFNDINPQTPVHILVVPKQHICCANAINEDNADVVAHIFTKIPEIADVAGIKDSGYRIINNCGKNGGQTVMHLHFHIMGGKDLGEKLV